MPGQVITNFTKRQQLAQFVKSNKYVIVKTVKKYKLLVWIMYHSWFCNNCHMTVYTSVLEMTIHESSCKVVNSITSKNTTKTISRNLLVIVL